VLGAVLVYSISGAAAAHPRRRLRPLARDRSADGCPALVKEAARRTPKLFANPRRLMSPCQAARNLAALPRGRRFLPGLRPHARGRPSFPENRMLEFALILALLIVARRLRRAASAPPQPLRIDIYHHFDGGPGEQQPEPSATGDNVVPLRRRA